MQTCSHPPAVCNKRWNGSGSAVPSLLTLPVRDRKSRKACIFVLLDERSSKYLMDFNRRPCIGGYF